MFTVLLTIASVWGAQVPYRTACWPAVEPIWSVEITSFTTVVNCSQYAITRSWNDRYTIHLLGNEPTFASRVLIDTVTDCTFDYTVVWNNQSWVSHRQSDVPDSVWLTSPMSSPSSKRMNVVWDKDAMFNPSGQPYYRIKLPTCLIQSDPWSRLKRFSMGNLASIQATYGLLWSMVYAGYIYTGIRAEWYQKRNISAIMEAFGVVIGLVCVAVFSIEQWMWWSVLGVAVAWCSVVVPMCLQLGSNGRCCGTFLLPTEERGFRLGHGFFRSLFAGFLFVLAALL